MLIAGFHEYGAGAGAGLAVLGFAPQRDGITANTAFGIHAARL